MNENQQQKHSERYNDLSQEDKDKVDAILSYLDGMTIADIKSLIFTVNRELDFRGSLNQK